MSKVDRFKLILFIFFRLTVAAAAIISALEGDWTSTAMSALTLVVFFLPSIINRKLKLDFSSEFEIVVIIFIYAAMFLGEVQSFYNKFWWWDIMLHSSSGLILGAVGFSLVDTLNRNEKVSINLSPVFVAVFSFCFTLTIGVIWEFYEFAMDSIFGFNMMKSGLVDTMWDLIFDAIGGLIFSILGLLHLKGKIRILDRFITRYRVIRRKAARKTVNQNKSINING
ncbi:MAG: hypothetical protein ACOX7R_13225 [Acetivibrionales bacterium]